MRILLALALYVAAVGAYVGPARGQGLPVCATHTDMAARLLAGWEERRAAVMLGADGSFVELYANRASGTWTLVRTFPGEPSCIVTSGQGFETVTPVWGEPA